MKLELKGAEGDAVSTLNLVDGVFRGSEAGGFGGGHVEGLGFAIDTGALAGDAQAASAGGDDLHDELLTVHTHVHGHPVFRQLLGQLQLFQRPAVSAAAAALLGRPGGGRGED